MIWSYPVKASVAASCNQYLQRQADHYQRYLAATDAIGHDMEVAEARTRVGHPRVADGPWRRRS